MRISISLISSISLVLIFLHPTNATMEGFYCDVFQDEGTQISGRDLDIDCEYINFSMEHLECGDNYVSQQAEIMIKNDNDDKLTRL